MNYYKQGDAAKADKIKAAFEEKGYKTVDTAFNDKDLGRQVFVEIHLVPLVWYKRLLAGLKYIFGYKCCYGNFEEMILSPKHARQIYDLYRFLRPKLTKEELAKLTNCNGQAVEIGL